MTPASPPAVCNSGAVAAVMVGAWYCTCGEGEKIPGALGCPATETEKRRPFPTPGTVGHTSAECAVETTHAVDGA